MYGYIYIYPYIYQVKKKENPLSPHSAHEHNMKPTMGSYVLIWIHTLPVEPMINRLGKIAFTCIPCTNSGLTFDAYGHCRAPVNNSLPGPTLIIGNKNPNGAHIELKLAHIGLLVPCMDNNRKPPFLPISTTPLWDRNRGGTECGTD